MRIQEKGRPSLEETKKIKEKILEIVEKAQVAHPERIRRDFSKFNDGKLVSWATVRKYLDELSAEGKLREQIITKGARRKLSVFRVIF